MTTMIPTGDKPAIGARVFLPNKWHIAADSDDIDGGAAIITSVRPGRSRSNDNHAWFITCQETQDHSFNWCHLLKGDQDKLKHIFKGCTARLNTDKDNLW